VRHRLPPAYAERPEKKHWEKKHWENDRERLKGPRPAGAAAGPLQNCASARRLSSAAA